MLDTVIDNDTELFDESIFDISCEVKDGPRGTACDSPADVFVSWHPCGKCGDNVETEYMCIPCYTDYIKAADKYGDGECDECGGFIWMKSVTSIR